MSDQKKYRIARDGKPSAVSVLILSVISALLSLVTPLAFSGSNAVTALSWIACILCVGTVAFALRRGSALIISAIAFTFAVSLTGSPVPVAIAAGTVISCGIYSSLFASSRAIMLPLPILSALLSLSASFIMTGDVFISMLSLIGFIPSLVMGLLTKKGSSRTAAISAFAIIAVIELCLGSLLHIYFQNGALSEGLIISSADYLEAYIVSAMQTAIEEAGKVALTEDIVLMINSAASETINVLVGVCAAALICTGFLVQRIQTAFFELFSAERLELICKSPIRASLISAIVYTAAHIASFTSGPSDGAYLPAYAALNLSIVLMPLMAYVGFCALASLPRRIGLLALAAWLGLGLLSAMLSSSIIEITALCGAFYTFFVSTDAWAKEHYSKGENQ